MSDEKKQDAQSVPCDLAKLQVAQSLRDYHHKALWQEETHFTWLVSIVFSADILLATTDKLSTIEKLLLMLGVSLVGVVLSLIGLRVLRSESDNFQVALHRLIIEHNRCFQYAPLPEVPASSQNKNPIRLMVLGLLWRVSIRESFQLVLILFCLIFVLITIATGYIVVFFG